LVIIFLCEIIIYSPLFFKKSDTEFVPKNTSVSQSNPDTQPVIPIRPQSNPYNIIRDGSAKGTLRTKKALYNADYRLIIGTDYCAVVRPGATGFVSEMTKYFDLALCSTEDRDYVADVLGILDPTGTVFGNRVLDKQDLCGTTKRVPISWGGVRNAIVVANDANGWESDAMVFDIRTFIAETSSHRFPTLSYMTDLCYSISLKFYFSFVHSTWTSTGNTDVAYLYNMLITRKTAVDSIMFDLIRVGAVRPNATLDMPLWHTKTGNCLFYSFDFSSLFFLLFFFLTQYYI
jgi:hypothetical protein